MVERITAAQFKAARRKPKDREGPIQCQIVTYLRNVLPDSNIVTAIENKVYSAKEGSRRKAQGQVAGMPDIMVLTYLGPLFFEVKAEGGRVQPVQKALHDRLRNLGYRIAVVRSVQDVRECLSEWAIGANEPDGWQHIGDIAAKMIKGVVR